MGVARGQSGNVAGGNADHRRDATKRPAFEQPGVEAGELVFPTSGGAARTGAFVVIGPPRILQVEHVGGAEQASPDAAERERDELGGGKEHEVDFFAAKQAGAGEQKMEPAAEAEVADAEQAGPAAGQRRHAHDPDVGWKGVGESGLADAVLPRVADAEHDRFPPAGPIVRQAHADALQVGRVDGGEMRADDQHAAERRSAHRGAAPSAAATAARSTGASRSQE